MNWVFWLNIILICIFIWGLVAPLFKPLSQILKDLRDDIKENIEGESEEN